MDDRTLKLELKIKQLQKTLGTLITWIAQSAVSPINRNEAIKLLEMLNNYD